MRKNGWSAARQVEFINHLAEHGSVRAACRAMGVGEHQIYKIRRHPQAAEFRAAWEAALDIGIQRIEDVAMDRALHGVEEPVYSGGEIVGTRRKYNDRLLMFLLRNRAPERFAHGLTGSGPHPSRPDAITKMKKRRLKKKWRAKWERERVAAIVNDQDVLDSIDTKIMAMKQEWIDRDARHSPATLAARAEYERLKLHDEATGYDCTQDPQHDLYEAPIAWPRTRPAAPATLPPPEPSKEPEAETG